MKAEEKPVSEYGEPWSLVGEPGDCWIEDSGGGSIVEQSCDCSDAQICRLVQCVNALAGIPNPEAVRELVRGCRMLLEATCSPEENRAEDVIERALAAMDAAPSTGAQQK